MKKITALLLVLIMAVSLVACSFVNIGKGDKDNDKDNDNDKTTAPAAQLPASALEIAETIWNSYKEESEFNIIGGNAEYHFEQMEKDETYQMPNAPGAYDLTYAENLANAMAIPTADMENVVAAATMTHAMNANIFSCGVFELKEGTDAKAFAEHAKNGIENNQWMCGAPEKLVIAAFGEKYVLVAFGGEAAVTPFQGDLTAAYADAELLYTEDLAG